MTTGILPNDPAVLKVLCAEVKARPRQQPLPENERRELLVWIEELPRHQKRAVDRNRHAHMLAEILSEDIAVENERLLGRNRSDSTLRSYKQYFKHFQDWATKLSASALPTSPEIVVTYALRRFAEGESPQRIAERVSAIRFYHDLYDESGHQLYSPGCNLDGPIVRAAMRFIRRNYQPNKPQEEKPKANGATPTQTEGNN
jgi:hypothetical protein